MILCEEEGGDTAEDSRCRCDHILLCLNGRRAPGLEQKHNNGPGGWSRFYGRLLNSGCMGAEDAGTMALKKLTKKKIVGVAPNAFAGQAKQPTDRELAKVLSDDYDLWQRLVADLKGELKIDVAEWHTASIKYGWSLRLQLKKRNIVYLGPREGYFLAAFALGDRAVAAAKKSGLPHDVLRLIAQSKRYPEGTAVRIEVRADEDVEIVKTLARVKIEN
jgi:hypothetical protein